MINTRRLQQLAMGWRSCTDCDLSMGRTNVVFYRGDPGARILIMGEAPGADEDRRGVPFLGPAGRILDDVLKAAKIEPEEAFIMNTVGCRPPNNRVPTRPELKACEPRTHAMIKIVDPAVIILLGRTAAKMAGVTSIGPWRGKPVEVELHRTFRAVVTYHPSFLLRQGNTPKLQRKMISDIKVARAIANAEGRSANEP